MPRKEVYLQEDMFSGELVDTRSRRQKKRDKQRRGPQQMEMFETREIAQFGVKANPKMPLSPRTPLELAMEDPRTEEEKEADKQREIEENTVPMFENDEPDKTSPASALEQYRDIKQQYPNAIVFFTG